MTDTETLIERLEAATPKGERAAILAMLDHAKDADWLTFDQWRAAYRFWDVGAYLDAAMTLVPEGWRWHVDYRPAAQCWHGLHCVFDDEGDCTGTTPALALSIAALKAREAGK